MSYFIKTLFLCTFFLIFSPIAPDLYANDLPENPYTGKYTSIINYRIDSVYSYKYNDINNFQVGTYTADKEYSSVKISSYILPSVLISYGFVSRYTGMKKIDKEINRFTQDHFATNLWIDNLLWAVPYGAVFTLDWCGIKPRNNFKDRVIVSVSSGVLTYGLITITKLSTNRRRPDGNDKKSFPSLHTGFAFTGAHILMKEYSHVSPWIGIAGYTVATATGILRMTNNKHWFSDIVAGAGFGILSAELSYLVLPYLSKTFTFGSEKSNKQTSLSFYPSGDYRNIGFNISFTF